MPSQFEAAPQLETADLDGINRRLDALSADPILAAVENYRGVIVDLDQNLTIDAAALAEGRSSLKRSLLHGGLRAGDRIIMAVGNGPRFVAALAATLEIGASPLLVHYQLPPAELRRTALRYGAAFVLTDCHDERELAEVGSARPIKGAGWNCYELTSINQSDPGFFGEYPSLLGVPLHPTSGSTGLPKVAARPGACAIAEAANYIGATGINQEDAILVVTPMSHAYAYGMGLMVPLLSGANILSMRRFVLKNVLDALENQRVTIFPTVPAMLDMLLFGKGGNLLARPRMVFSAGAPLKRRTAENFRKVTGQLIRPLYGTTETGGISIGTSGALPEEVDRVGPVMRGVEARIEPADQGSLEAGTGRVAIRSTSMMAGYLSPFGIDTSILRNNWFQTGDLGRLAAHGNLQLLGRESEMINVAGMKVVPSEVEEVLALFPGVTECKVYAGKRGSGNEFVKAAVVAAASLDLPSLKAHCAAQLVYYKRPDVIVRLDALPRSPAGKILRDQLP
jgi:long-chain acyl-CoA synthetase